MGNYKKIAGIYCITNTISGKRYIGHSINIRKRWDAHKYSLRRNLHKNTHLQSSWIKHGEVVFNFTILEILPFGMTTKEYEQIEAKWVELLGTNNRLKGYNVVIPGDVPKKYHPDNLVKKEKVQAYIPVVIINSITSEVKEFDSYKDVASFLKISSNKISQYCSYWKGVGKSRSIHSWMLVKKSEYNSDFDYASHTKPRKKSTKIPKIPKKKIYIRKAIEDIIPYKERNLKRTKVIAVNIITGQETVFNSITECCKTFSNSKVYKCLTNEFGKYKHRNHYFRKAL